MLAASRGIVVIVGQGYVGASLADSCLRAGYRVHGVDRNPVVRERAAQRFASYSGYTVGEDLVPFDIGVIAVDTSLGTDGKPNLESVRSTASQLGSMLRDDALIINESTVPPGTTDGLIAVVREASGLPLAGLNLAFSPERIDPGSESWSILNTPKLVAGSNLRARELAARFYRSLSIEVVEVQNIRDAEFAKLTENAFRAVGIALANELATVARRLGVDIRAALDAAATKPFGYLDFRPGIGVGGDCIPTDPHFLIQSAEDPHGEHLPLVRQALEVNSGMPNRVAMRAVELLAERGTEPGRVLLLGLAHKRNCSDMTNAPSRLLAGLLVQRGIEVIALDPRIDPMLAPPGVRLVDGYVVGDADIAIAVTVHDELVGVIGAIDLPILDARAELVGPSVVRL